MKNKELSKLFKALQDEKRLEIIEILKTKKEERQFKPNNVENIDSFCPQDILIQLQKKNTNMTKTKLSYHLKEMRSSGVLKLTREGKRYFYRINKSFLIEITNWIKKL